MRMLPLWGTSMGCPSAQMVPEVGRSSPAIKLSTVDLPHPDGPTMQRNSPSFTARLMFSKAIRVPPGDGKERETFSKMSLLSLSHGVSDTLGITGTLTKLTIVLANVLANRFSSFFIQHLVQDGEIIDAGKIGALPAQKSRFKRPACRGEQRGANGIV